MNGLTFILLLDLLLLDLTEEWRPLWERKAAKRERRKGPLVQRPRKATKPIAADSAGNFFFRTVAPQGKKPDFWEGTRPESTAAPQNSSSAAQQTATVEAIDDTTTTSNFTAMYTTVNTTLEEVTGAGDPQESLLSTTDLTVSVTDANIGSNSINGSINVTDSAVFNSTTVSDVNTADSTTVSDVNITAVHPSNTSVINESSSVLPRTAAPPTTIVVTRAHSSTKAELTASKREPTTQATTLSEKTSSTTVSESATPSRKTSAAPPKKSPSSATTRKATSEPFTEMPEEVETPLVEESYFIPIYEKRYSTGVIVAIISSAICAILAVIALTIIVMDLNRLAEA